MSRAVSFFPLLLALLGLMLALPDRSAAQPPNQAALVVRLDDGRVESRCVSFTEPQISGYDLLVRAELDEVIEVQGMGALVCSIADQGCPANDCLCQCRGGDDCVYWSYWHLVEGDWQYSAGGASVYPIRHGAVDGWSWGPGAVSQAVAPPEISFAEVCGADAPGTELAVGELAADGSITAVPYAFFLAISLPLFVLVWRANRKTAV